MTKFRCLILFIIFVLFLPGCRFNLIRPDLLDNDIKKNETTELLITPSQTTDPSLLTPTVVTTLTDNPDKKIDQPPTKPSSAIRVGQTESVYNSYCSYSTHTIEIADQYFTLLDFERCVSHEPSGEFSRKESWWDYIEIIKPFHSSFTWWRYAPNDDWGPAPLEYHDRILIEMSVEINHVHDLDGWQVTEEYLEVGDDRLFCWHYQYQGDFDVFPSNLILDSEVEDKFWEDGFVNELRADLWVAPSGYILKEIIQWDVNYILSNGTTINGLEIITNGLKNINQEIDVPDFVSPPIPAQLTSVYVGKWLEYGDPSGIWVYQVGKSPQETLVAYLLSEGDDYVIHHFEGNSQNGYSVLVEDNTNKVWGVTIDPKETAKKGLVSILVMSQK